MQKQAMSPLQPVHNLKPYKRVQGTHQIEHFFRAAAGLEIDKEDIRRYYDFIDTKIVDLLLVAQHAAKANGRVAVELRDLPIAKGAFKRVFRRSRCSTSISDLNAYCMKLFPSHEAISFSARNSRSVCW